jgi:hypothetical protein
MNSEIIRRLSDLALKNYRENISPDPYAAAAAHLVSSTSAAQFNSESADAAAFVAIASIIDFSTYSAQQAAFATGMHHAMKHYAVKDTGLRRGLDTTAPAFESLAQKLEKVSFSREAQEIYSARFNASEQENYRLALHAATVVYNHAYASARAAYTHGAAVAARYPAGEKREMMFKKALTSRLTADLLHEPLEPSFFIQIMTSDAMKIFGGLLLVAGIAALIVGSCGLALAPVGLAVTAAGLSSSTMLTAGIVTSTASATLFAGRFFTVKRWKDANDKSAEAVNAMNDSEIQLSIGAS